MLRCTVDVMVSKNGKTYKPNRVSRKRKKKKRSKYEHEDIMRWHWYDYGGDQFK